jgi:hypothetical protein
VAAGSRLDRADASLALLVASRHHAPSAGSVLDAVRRAVGPERVIGCVAETVVGGDREVEEGPAVVVWLASLPEPAETFHMEFVRTSKGGVFAGYRFKGRGSGPYLLIGDPFSFPTNHLLRHLNEQIPGTIVMGGMTSGGMGPGETRLFVDDRVVDEGAVGARLPGVRIRPLVSQGCGPVGDVYTVTRAEGNVIHELGGRSPLLRFQELADGLSPEDRTLLGRGLYVGRAIDEYKVEPGRGDFLIRQVMGVDQRSGALAVGIGSRWERPSSSTCGTRPQPTRIFARSSSSRPSSRRTVPCSLRATGGARGCSRSSITTRRWYRGNSGACPLPASTAPGRSARSAGRTSCTASRPRWPCSSTPEPRRNAQPDRRGESCLWGSKTRFGRDGAGM